jgi:hypothetical protein
MTHAQAKATTCFMQAIADSDLPQAQADADAGFRFRSALAAAEYLARKGKLTKGKPTRLIPSHALAARFACDLKPLTVKSIGGL